MVLEMSTWTMAFCVCLGRFGYGTYTTYCSVRPPNTVILKDFHNFKIALAKSTVLF
jgi:hypothetical protein